jgi:hypothetical protein
MARQGARGLGREDEAPVKKARISGYLRVFPAISG